MARKRSRSRGTSDGSVSRRTILTAVTLGGAGLLGLRETGALSAGMGDRVFSAGTAGDDSAFLGIAPGDPDEYDELAVSGTDGETVPVLTLTNNSGGALDSVIVTSTPLGSPNIEFTDIGTPRSIAPGASETVTATLSCGSASTEDVRLSIQVSGPGGSVTAERDVSVECEPRICITEITGGEVEYELGGNDTEPCAVEIRSDDEVEVDMFGRATIEGYLDIVADSEVEVEMTGDSRIEGDLRIESGDEVEVELEGNSSIGGDLVIVADGDIEVEGESRVEGELDY